MKHTGSARELPATMQTRDGRNNLKALHQTVAPIEPDVWHLRTQKQRDYIPRESVKFMVAIKSVEADLRPCVDEAHQVFQTQQPIPAHAHRKAPKLQAWASEVCEETWSPKYNSSFEGVSAAASGITASSNVKSSTSTVGPSENPISSYWKNLVSTAAWQRATEVRDMSSTRRSTMEDLDVSDGSSKRSERDPRTEKTGKQDVSKINATETHGVPPEPWHATETTRALRNNSGVSPAKISLHGALESGKQTACSQPSVPQKTRRHHQAPPSRYCHVCQRSDKFSEHAVCSNIYKGICRKVVCRRCVEMYGLSPSGHSLAYRNFVCPHCRNACPSRAQCSTYSKTNMRRRAGTMKKRIPREQSRAKASAKNRTAIP